MSREEVVEAVAHDHRDRLRQGALHALYPIDKHGAVGSRLRREESHMWRDGTGARGEPAAAGLVAREFGLLDEQDARPALGEDARRARAGRPRAHDDRVVVIH